MLFMMALLLTSTEPQGDGHICWIREVHRERDGISVLFDEDRRDVSRQRGNNYVQFTTDSAVRHERIDDMGYHHVRAVPADLGDRLYVYNSPEDGCILTVVRQQRTLGVLAESNMNLPGLTPQTASEFIAAY